MISSVFLVISWEWSSLFRHFIHTWVEVLVAYLLFSATEQMRMQKLVQIMELFRGKDFKTQPVELFVIF